MGPRTNMEIIMALILLMCMTIFNAALFGDIAILTEEGSRKAVEFQEQIDGANSGMIIMDLPNGLRGEVRDYIISTQGIEYEQIQLKKFFYQISPSL